MDIGADARRCHLLVVGLVPVDDFFAVDDVFAVVTFAFAVAFAGVFAVDNVFVADCFFPVGDLSATVFFEVARFELVDVLAGLTEAADRGAPGSACTAMATCAGGVAADAGSGGTATAT